MKTKKIQAKDIIFYGIIMCIANLLASLAVSFVLKILVTPIENVAFAYVLTVVILLVGCFGIPLAILFGYLKNRVPAHYQPSDDNRLWLKNALRLILPGEIVRCILGTSCLGFIGNFGLLSLIPTFVFEQTYVIWSGRNNAIRQRAEFIFADYLAYVGIYLIYLALFLLAVLAIYRYLWSIGKREKDELIVHESKPRFY